MCKFYWFQASAFILMMAFAALYTYTRNLPIVVSAFSGLQAIIVAIIANATLSFGKTTLKDWRFFAIAGIAAALFRLNVNPILVIFLAAVWGLALNRVKKHIPSHPMSSKKALPYTKSLLFILTVSAVGFFLLFLFDQTLFKLALLMFRIDLFAFGGGFASVPLVLHEIVEVRNWIDR